MADSKELQELFHSCMPLFIALGDEVRLNIIEALCIASQNGHTEGLNVNEITRQTNLSRPAISHHLKIMKSCGLVEVTQSGTSNYYRLTFLDCTKQLMKLGYLVERDLQPGIRRRIRIIFHPFQILHSKRSANL